MNSHLSFIETKEYKRFVEFCEACIKYKYIGICYGLPGVGKTLSSRYFSKWDYVEQFTQYNFKEIQNKPIEKKILQCKTLFYTAPAIKASKMTSDLQSLDISLNLAKSTYEFQQTGKENFYVPSFHGVELLIIDEIDRLKFQSLEQLRDIYDQNNFGMILVGMPGIEKRLSRYPQLYSRIGFAHEFAKLSKEEIHHILEYKWKELGLSIKLEDFSDYEAITTIIKITGGNFRLIQRLFSQIERIMEINQLRTITTEVVEAARDHLVIGIE